MKHVIPLQQSTKTKQTNLWPKVPAEFVKIGINHVFFDQLRRNQSKRSQKLGLNDQSDPQKLSIEK